MYGRKPGMNGLRWVRVPISPAWVSWGVVEAECEDGRATCMA